MEDKVRVPNLAWFTLQYYAGYLRYDSSNECVIREEIFGAQKSIRGPQRDGEAGKFSLILDCHCFPVPVHQSVTVMDCDGGDIRAFEGQTVQERARMKHS